MPLQTRRQMRTSTLRKRRQSRIKRAATPWRKSPDTKTDLRGHNILLSVTTTDPDTTPSSPLSTSPVISGTHTAEDYEQKGTSLKEEKETEREKVVPRRTASEMKTTRNTTTTTPRRLPRLRRQTESREGKLY